MTTRLRRLEEADERARIARAAGMPRRAPVAAGYVDAKTLRQGTRRWRLARRREKARARARRGLWLVELIRQRIAKAWAEQQQSTRFVHPEQEDGPPLGFSIRVAE